MHSRLRILSIYSRLREETKPMPASDYLVNVHPPTKIYQIIYSGNKNINKKIKNGKPNHGKIFIKKYILNDLFIFLIKFILFSNL